MGKDPAVLWYPADYLVGVIDLSWEEQGRYTYLLNLQHQKGHLDITKIMPDCPKTVLAKFLKDDNGLYFNVRMETEMQRRQKYTESRRRNGQRGGRPPNAESLKQKWNTAKKNLRNDIGETRFNELYKRYAKYTDAELIDIKEKKELTVAEQSIITHVIRDRRI